MPRIELVVSVLPDFLFDQLHALFALLQSPGEQDTVFLRKDVRSDLAEI
jgi:hypothetical protein